MVLSPTRRIARVRHALHHPLPRRRKQSRGERSALPAAAGAPVVASACASLPLLLLPFGSVFDGGTLILIAFAAFAASQFSQPNALPGSGFYDDLDNDDDDERSVYTLVRLRVALLSSARGVQREFESLASEADTSTQRGIKLVLDEAAISLLRASESIVYASWKAQTTRSAGKLETMFNAVSLKERQKLAAETLVNVDGVSKASRDAAEPVAMDEKVVGEYVVVTMLCSVAGRFALPASSSSSSSSSSTRDPSAFVSGIFGGKSKEAATIDSPDMLADVLRRIGALRTQDVFAVEVLWVPQRDGDTLTTEEVLSDFSDLRPI